MSKKKYNKRRHSLVKKIHYKKKIFNKLKIAKTFPIKGGSENGYVR
jgi:hypothetical protein